MSDDRRSLNSRPLGASGLAGFSWWYILIDLLLWAAFFWVHFNERRLHAAIPMWVHMPLWSGLFGAAVGGLAGPIVPMLGCAVIAGIILPVLILAVFALAFSGG
jgi:hypothetical protein